MQGLRLDGTLLRVSAAPATVVSVHLHGSEAAADKSELAGRLAGQRALLALIDGLDPPARLEAFAPRAFWAGAEHLLATREQVAEEHRRDLAEWDRAEPVRSSAVEVVVQTGSSTSARLEIEAVAGWATWRPAYRIEVFAAEARLVELADVWHHSGLKAEGVRLAVSGPPPALAEAGWRPWVVRAERGYEEQSAALYHARPEVRRPPPMPSGGAEAGPRSAPPRFARSRDVQWAWVTPDRFRVEFGPAPCRTQIRYLARPVADPRVAAHLEVDPLVELPGGPVEVRFHGRALPPFEVPDGRPGKSWRVVLGTEPGLSAHRALTTRLEVEGVLQREDVHRVEVEITVQSGLDRPTEVVVEEPIPVATDPRLRVRPELPAHAEHDPRAGIARATVSVPQNGEARVVFGYRVEAPHDFRLVQALGADG